MKGFGAVDELVSIVTGGIPVNAVMSGVDLERALQYGTTIASRSICQQYGKKSGKT